jgi:CheY-like chemotaxis protein
MVALADILKPEVNWNYRTILIVDDIEPNLRFLEEALSGTCAKIERAKNGNEAIQKCLNNLDIDLVLMDLHLPGISGLAATREIKKLRNDVTIIAQTAFVLSGERQKTIDAGCDEYIAKPLRKNELIIKIRNCLINAGKKA